MSPFWISLEQDDGGIVTTGAIIRVKLHQIVTTNNLQQTNTQLFTGRMPFLSSNQQCQSTDSDNSFIKRFVTDMVTKIFYSYNTCYSDFYISITSIWTHYYKDSTLRNPWHQLCTPAMSHRIYNKKCLFACLVFNSTFSTNRLYRAIVVGNISRMTGDNIHT